MIPCQFEAVSPLQASFEFRERKASIRQADEQIYKEIRAFFSTNVKKTPEVST